MNPKNKPTAYFLTGILLTVIIAAISFFCYKWYAHLVAFAGWEDIGYEHQPTWQTYRNDELGFEIQYPTDFEVRPSNFIHYTTIMGHYPATQLLDLTFVKPNSLIDYNGNERASIAPDGIYLYVTKIPQKLSVEQMLSEETATLNSTTHLIIENKAIIAGAKAATISYASDDIGDYVDPSIKTKPTGTKLIIGDKLFEISITGNVGYRQVLKTFRLLNPEPKEVLKN